MYWKKPAARQRSNPPTTPDITLHEDDGDSFQHLDTGAFLLNCVKAYLRSESPFRESNTPVNLALHIYWSGKYSQDGTNDATVCAYLKQIWNLSISSARLRELRDFLDDEGSADLVFFCRLAKRLWDMKSASNKDCLEDRWRAEFQGSRVVRRLFDYYEDVRTEERSDRVDFYGRQ
ncbi:hypothetical protein MMC25_007475 [Agyrium rufum]|nr:hypothetical protein [Agyrium rufum]